MNELPNQSKANDVLVICRNHRSQSKKSWGALYWTIPGEIYPVEVRSAGQGTAVALNLGLNFVQAQCFLAMLCAFKYGIFIFYACWLVVMTAFAMAFVPETKGVPLESMGHVFARHWYWGAAELGRKGWVGQHAEGD